MRSFLGLFFLIDFGGFFNFGKTSTKHTGDVHPFKPLFVCVSQRFLGFFKLLSRFRCFGFLCFSFLYDRRCFSAMKNSGRFHASFSFLFLLVLRGNRAGRFGILEKAVLVLFDGVFRDRLFCMRFGSSARGRLVFAVFG